MLAVSSNVRRISNTATKSKVDGVSLAQCHVSDGRMSHGVSRALGKGMTGVLLERCNGRRIQRLGCG